MKMKRLATGLLAGAFGALLLAPAAGAWESDSQAIYNNRAKIWEDRQEMRQDLRNGDWGGVREEQAEIAQHRAAIARHMNGYYNGYYYYPRAYTYYAPAPVYAYGYRHHRRWHRWHHDHDDD